MEQHISIVDLFSGPGGLGEGFSSFEDPSGDHPFRTCVAIEKDPAAHATLRLRSFLRKFESGFPDEYYEFLNGEREEPNWSRLYPDEWGAAEDETHCMELGEELTNNFLASRIEEIRARSGDRTVLIGGPPCQAYSLVGRARNAGIAGYLPHKDERNFLYQKYVDALRQLEPMAFVMENVKGMLSSAIKGDRIFHRVLSDLRSAAGSDSYRLFALSPDVYHDGEPSPKDFIIRMESHGIPQTRHRVIIVGLRRDLADGLPSDPVQRLPRWDSTVTVNDVIGRMPPLRSRLSRNDDYAAWQKEVLNANRVVFRGASFAPWGCRAAFRASLAEAKDKVNRNLIFQWTTNRGTGIPTSCPETLKKWLADPYLERLPNNQTRGHMPSDLARYLFVAAFGRATGRSPKASEFPAMLAPNHKSWKTGKFQDRFRVQINNRPASTITSHISKDGHYFIHPDPAQCRSLTVREAARLQTFPDNYYFKGNRTQQYIQVGNAVPPFLALQIAESLWKAIGIPVRGEGTAVSPSTLELIEN